MPYSSILKEWLLLLVMSCKEICNQDWISPWVSQFYYRDHEVIIYTWFDDTVSSSYIDVHTIILCFCSFKTKWRKTG